MPNELPELPLGPTSASKDTSLPLISGLPPCTGARMPMPCAPSSTRGEMVTSLQRTEVVSA
ncbi:MAG: hypothetical protein U1F43_10730 [Myxococcota bacterium]